MIDAILQIIALISGLIDLVNKIVTIIRQNRKK